MVQPDRIPISRSLIVETALEIIDELAVDALSLRGVAARLGISAPSLYNYFDNKVELLEEIARTLLLAARTPAEPGEDWREHIVRIAVGARRAILKHPNAAPLLLQYFPREMLIDVYEGSISTYKAPPELHLMITEGIELLTYGSALFCAAYRARGKPAWPSFPKSKYPKLAVAIASSTSSHEKMFADMLRRFLQSF